VLAAIEEGAIPGDGRTAKLVQRRGKALLSKAATGGSLRR
jgi:hypothetical protein